MNGEGWDWGQYDGEEIAGRFCDQDQLIPQDMTTAFEEPPPEVRTAMTVRFNEQVPSYRTSGSRSRARPVLKHDAGRQQKAKTSWGRSLYLWGKFSVAIILAVGGAIINGPEEMLKDCEDHTPRKSSAANRTSGKGRETAARKERTAILRNTTDPEIEEQCGRQAGIAESECVVTSSNRRTPATPDGNSLQKPSPARRRRRPPLPNFAADKMYMFGSPCEDGRFEYFDDSIPMTPEASIIGHCDAGHATTFGAQTDEDQDGLGRPRRVRNLSLCDLQEVDDGQTTLRARSGKRPHSLMS